MIEKQAVRTGRHCVHNLHCHLVFITKYRKDIFNDAYLEFLEQTFSNICSDFQVELYEFNGEANHVHLLVNYPPKISLSRLVNSLKGVSSRYLRKKFPELSKYYWKGGFWSASYFAGSCGGAPLDILVKYIQDQDRPSTSPTSRKGF